MDKLLDKYNIYSGFILLIFLNIFDGVATYIGLNMGFYIEENFILDYIYKNSDIMFIFIKIIIPTLILSILMIIVGSKITKIIRYMIYFSNTIYTILFIYHIALYSIAMNLTIT